MQFGMCYCLQIDNYMSCLYISERLLKLLDYYEGSFQDFIGHNDRVQLVKFSPDGKYLFTASHSEIFIWDVTIWACKSWSDRCETVTWPCKLMWYQSL